MYYLILAVILIALDQGIKYAVLNYVGISGQIPIISDVFYITCIRNDGIAMGMLAGKQSVIIAITAVIMTAIAIYIWRGHRKGNKIELTLLTIIVSGGVGNLADRIRLNYVVDYLDFRIWPYIFNFADICVVLGCAGLFVYVFLMSREK